MKIMRHCAYLIPLIACIALSANAAPAKKTDHEKLDHAAMAQFIKKMVHQYHFDSKTLQTLFADAHYKQSIIDAITRPAESMSWYHYRQLFLTQSRIQSGAEFVSKHAKLLQKVQKKYGVPATIIAAIIGIETNYGHNKGHYRVIDALVTLAFAYPPRSRFFKSELKQYLLLSRKQKFDPAVVRGSYAGAMGAPQFIASSYCAYAIDFDDDGESDLWNSWPDITASVAHYFSKNGWQRGKAVVVRAHLKSGTDNIKAQPSKAITLKELTSEGVVSDGKISQDIPVSLIALSVSDNQKQYWIALPNFRSIMRYNHSPLYAMAAYQLSLAIEQHLLASKAT